ncbi:MAG: hypothetical protein KGM17_07085 [Sphingomonadales bacterium]|nr:hypothetical protein [Sphingomonadales bacterium]
MEWTRDRLLRRIDRCYHVAAWTRLVEKRRRYVALARQYRRLLAGLPGHAGCQPVTG